jgi:hypothetical protein
MVDPPNPYDNLPPVGSTTEFYYGEGRYALDVADYLKRRKDWLDALLRSANGHEEKP